MWFVLHESILAVTHLPAVFKIHLYRLFDYLFQYLSDGNYNFQVSSLHLF